MTASSDELIDLKATRVPIGIPLGVIGALGIVQLAMGTDPLIMALCAFAIAVPLLPLHFYGRDLYAMTGLAISMHYTGVALLMKTVYGQTLESNLFNAYTAFSLDALLMLVVTAVLFLARALDPGPRGAIFTFPTDLRSLRRLSIFCFCVGFLAFLVVAAKTSGEGTGGAGAAFVIAAGLAEFVLLGASAETLYGIKKSNGRTFITPLLACSIVLMLSVALAVNARGLFLSFLIAIVTTAFVFRMVRLRHLIAGLVVAGLFTSVMTPITLFLRMQREGMPKSQFIELVKNTVIRVATDPAYFTLIAETMASVQQEKTTEKAADFDYYGDRSNVLNRVSFVALLDAVANGARTRKPLGIESVEQSLTMNLPGFLGFERSNLPSGLGDWLNWQMGMGNPAEVAYLNFGLPMEGLASWGVIGFVAYPFIFFLVILLITARISTLKLPLPASIFLFTNIQLEFVESTSDGLLSMVDRGYIIIIFIFFLIRGLLFSGKNEERPTPAAASTTN